MSYWCHEENWQLFGQKFSPDALQNTSGNPFRVGIVT